MQAGNYNKKITLEQYTETRDEYGGVIETWAVAKTMFANMRVRSAREVFQSDQLQNYKTAVFTIRYTSGIDEQMRVVCEGKTYKIEGIQEIGRRKGFQIIAEWDSDNG